jgi:hypothetical protein
MRREFHREIRRDAFRLGSRAHVETQRKLREVEDACKEDGILHPYVQL